MSLDPRGEDLRRFLDDDDGGPIVMLNLLRFRAGGRATYEAYMRATAPHLARVGGSLVHAGLGSSVLVAGPGPAWDAVLLVRYPSRRAFLAMITDPDYLAGTALRTEALEETILEATVPWPIATSA